ncbi:MAG: Hpt domain-containing protein [Burkholderiales bacterium]|jgi:HPt (histidine-containing phosphotransfer) domain-containing protein
MSTGQLMDVEKTLLGLGGDETLLGKVAQIFARTAPGLLDLIGSALDADDLKRAYAEAHSLKGSVGVFDAPQVLQCVTDLAQRAKERDLAATRDAFAAARPLVERLLAEITPLLSGNRAAAASGRR